MILFDDHPEIRLDETEAKRCWMLPSTVLELIGLGDADKHPAARQFWSNITKRDHLPSERSGTAKTSARLYSLAGAVKARVMWEITRNGRTYEDASAIGDATIKMLVGLINYFKKVSIIPERKFYIIYYWDFAGKIICIDANSQIIKEQISSDKFPYDIGILYSGDIAARAIEEYASHWWENLCERGLAQSYHEKDTS